MIRQNFNADWTVEKGDGNSRMNSFLGNTQTKTVHLPYDAMIHEARTPDTKNGAQTGFYPGGEYIFQKHFTAPQAWQGKPVSLVFEGVYQTALVYLNGWLLTRNVNGYAEFTVEAGPYLKYGADNLLKVIADNSLEPNCRWYTGSGIYRPVHLMVKPKDGVRPVKIRTVSIAPAVVEVQTEIEHAAVEIWDGAQCVAKGAPGTIEIPQAKLWDAEHPNLYTCVVKTENDEESVPFGIRTLTWSAKTGLCVNGRAVKLRGGCIHHDNGILGACGFADAEERRIRIMKKGGLQRRALRP